MDPSINIGETKNAGNMEYNLIGISCIKYFWAKIVFETNSYNL